MNVNMRPFGVSAVLLLFWGLASMTSASAQRRMGMDTPMPMYDTRTEVTLTGTVEDVKTMRAPMRGPGRMRMAMEGTHLMLNTDQGTIEVHLGPSAFLTEKNLEIAKGDTVEITGSRITIGDSDALLARAIRKGTDAWQLRDEHGRPFWAMPSGR